MPRTVGTVIAVLLLTIVVPGQLGSGYAASGVRELPTTNLPAVAGADRPAHPAVRPEAVAASQPFPDASLVPSLSAGMLWTDLGPTQGPRPSDRENTGLAFDSSDGTTVLFGGWGPVNTSYQAFDQTWTFSLGTWSELHPQVRPSSRVGPLMADDPQEGGVVLWGGLMADGTALNDTWLFRGGTWTSLLPLGSASSPPPASYWNATMVYDSSSTAIVLLLCIGNSSETWQFNNGAWHDLTPASSPGSSSYAPLLLDDPSDGGVLLVGGATVNETWLFSLGGWTQLSPRSPLPWIVFEAGSYDPMVGAPVVAGGFGNGSARPNQTWQFANDSWSLVSSAVMPSSVTYGSAAFDRKDGYLLLFGGEVARPLSYFVANETWALGPDVLSYPSASPNPTDVGVNVSFVNPYSNTSTGYAQAWTLGDGNSTTLPRFSHAYDSSGTYSIRLSASDGFGHFNNTTVTVSVFSRPTVSASSGPLPADAGVAVAFSSRVLGGAPPLAFAWDFGDLATATLPNATHTFATPGTYTVTLAVTDNAGVRGRANVSVQVNAAPTVSLRASWPVVDVGQSVQVHAVTANGTGPFRLTYGGVPPGCAPENVTAFVCSPTAPGPYSLTVQVVDARGSIAESAGVGLSVYTAMSVSLETDLPAIDLGQLVNFSTMLTGGAPGPVLLSFAGLPPGCSPPAGGSRWQCQPTAEGTYNVTLSVNDSSAAPWVSVPLTFVVNPYPTLRFSVTPPDVVVGGTLLAFYANVSGGTSPYHYAYSGLPTGCSTGDQPELPCIPSASGSFDVTVTVTDAVGVDRLSNLTVVVEPHEAGNGGTSSPLAEVMLGIGILGAAVAAVFLLRRKRKRPPPTEVSS